MYYLKREPYKVPEHKINKTDGTVHIIESYMTDASAIYKHHDFSRFYRGDFNGIDGKYQGMKLYTCKTLKKILEIQAITLNYCGELFDIYDENGKVEIETWGDYDNYRMKNPM